MSDFIIEEDFWNDVSSYKVQETKINATDDAELNENIESIDLSKISRGIIHGLDNTLYITRNGIYLDVTGINHSLIRQLCNKFIIKNKSNFGNKWNLAKGFDIIKRPIMTPNGSTTQIMLLLPRFGFLEFYFNVLINETTRIENQKRKIEYAPMTMLHKFKLCNLSNINNQLISFLPSNKITAVGLKLESHQNKIIDYVISNHYNSQYKEFGFAGINLKLKTGAGKSYIALGLIDKLKVPTLLVVHNQPQAEDMYQLVKKYFPNTSVGIYHSAEKKLGDIMIIVIHSACGAEDYNFGSNKITIAEFYSRFGFAIFDESHKYCSPEFSKVFSRCQFTYMLGLSATPGERQDGFDPLTYWNIGPLIDIKEKIPNLLNDEPFTTKILGIKYLGSPEYTIYRSNESGRFDYDATLTQMMEDPYRLKLVIPILEYLHDNKRNVYIFSDRLEYLSVLRREFFAHLRSSKKTRHVDTLDDDTIEFMKTHPNYENYVKELQKSISIKLSTEQKKIQSELNLLSTSDQYQTFCNNGIDQNVWYAAVTLKNYNEYLQNINCLANERLNTVFQKCSDSLKEESTREYYNQLLETYRKNYIDDHIESKSTLSILTGGATGQRINTSANNATMIFTTYGYMGTGKSIPKMDTVLLLTPRRNGVEQVIGRIFRPGPNKNVRWIIDIIDRKINLGSQWYERLNVYNRQSEQNRSPTLTETEFSFESLENEKIVNKLNDVFNESIVISKELESIIDFSKLSINITKPDSNIVSKKKVRIIKKF